MKRRALLRRTAALGALAVAGCVSGDDQGAGETTTSPPDSPTETPTSEPITIVEKDIRTTATGCRSGESEETATVAFDRAANRVTVTGVLHTGTPCYRAVLRSVRFANDTGTLRLEVGAKSTGGVCVQCVARIEYEATVTLSSGAPDTVEIVHEGETVTTAPAQESGGGDSDGSGSDGGEGGDARPVLVSSNLEVLGRNPTGGDTTPGDIEFRSDAMEVVVTGTVRARNGCETAMVDSLAYDSNTDTLSANVVAEVPPSKEDQLCTQALADVRYRLTVGFENALPGTVEISQEGHGGMGAGHGEATASAPTTSDGS